MNFKKFINICKTNNITLPRSVLKRFYGKIEKVPFLGDKGSILTWVKKLNDRFIEDDLICRIKTEKSEIEVFGKEKGTLKKVFIQEGEDATEGQDLFEYDEFSGEVKKQEKKEEVKKVEKKDSESKFSSNFFTYYHFSFIFFLIIFQLIFQQ
jgi:hypothetical protein